jgi:integrase
VNLETGQIAVTTAKTGARVRIPVFPLLRECIEQRGTKGEKTDHVFPEQAQMCLTNPSGLGWRLKKFLEILGYAGDDTAPGAAGEIQRKRERGLRAASVRGMHSFRVTFVTLAIMSNLELELVRMITGHKTVQVVLENYFRPQDDQLRKAMIEKLPSLLLTGKKAEETDVHERLRKLIEQLEKKAAERIEKHVRRELAKSKK